MEKYFTTGELHGLISRFKNNILGLSEEEITVREDEQKKSKLMVEEYGRLKLKSTNELLKLLQSARNSGGSLHSDTGFYVTSTDMIKQILATRPHVPNKKEAKLIRQQNAKKFKGTRNKNR